MQRITLHGGPAAGKTFLVPDHYTEVPTPHGPYRITGATEAHWREPEDEPTSDHGTDPEGEDDEGAADSD